MNYEKILEFIDRRGSIHRVEDYGHGPEVETIHKNGSRSYRQLDELECALLRHDPRERTRAPGGKIGATSLQIREIIEGRGLLGATFRDLNGRECSIQESSVATQPCLWIGVDRKPETVVEGGCRMHIGRQMAAALVDVLRRFAETGELADGE